MQPAAGRERVAHFRILETLGQGGMGIVYKALDEKLGRTVALKVMKSKAVSERERRARFLREARTAASLTHRCVAAVYEVGEDEGAVYLAMEFIEGRTLRAHMAREPLALSDAVPIALEIAEGLGHAHKASVAHRDLKPDNVMVGADGAVKILDFGIAKLLAATDEPQSDGPPDSAPTQLQTREGAAFGTPGYMSPEQVRGISVDHRTDIYSFGVMLHEMLTARLPHKGATEMDTMAAILREVAPPPSQLSPSLPPEIDFIVAKCLEKDPDDRYQTCAEIVVDLRRLHRATSRSRDPGEIGPTADTAAGRIQSPAASRSRDRNAVSASEQSPPASAERRSPLLVVAIPLLAVALGVAVLWQLRERSPRTPSPPNESPPSAAPPARRAEPALRRLTAYPAERSVITAALSPDGNLLAFVQGEGIFVRGVSTAGEQALPLPTAGEPRHISWYADGQRLLVTLELDGKFSLWSMPLFGAKPLRVSADAHLGTPSRDGALVAYATERGIAVMPTAGGEARTLVALNAGEATVGLAWSPDSTRLAVLRRRDQAVTLVTIPRDGGDAVTAVADPRLFRVTHGSAGLVWLPNGKLVYGLWESEERIGLWGLVVDPNNGVPVEAPERIIGLDGQQAYSLSASADGRRIAYVRSEEQEDVYTASTAGKQFTSLRLTQDKRNDRPFGWTSEGVVFVSNRLGDRDIFVQADGDRDATQLVVAPGDDSAPTLMPGARGILYWRGPEPVEEGLFIYRLLRVPLGGGEQVTTFRTPPIETAADRPYNARCPLLSGPCVLSHYSSGEVVFFEFDAERGPGREIGRSKYNGFAAQWDVSPDGTNIAIVEDAQRIRIIPLAVRDPTKLELRRDCAAQFVGWAANGKRLYVTCVAAASPYYRLLEVDLPDGTQRELWSNDAQWILQPIGSPDGAKLAFGVREFDANVWVVEGLQ